MFIFGIYLLDTIINNTTTFQVHTVRMKRIAIQITRTDSRTPHPVVVNAISLLEFYYPHYYRLWRLLIRCGLRHMEGEIRVEDVSTVVGDGGGRKVVFKRRTDLDTPVHSVSRTATYIDAHYREKTQNYDMFFVAQNWET